MARPEARALWSACHGDLVGWVGVGVLEEQTGNWICYPCGCQVEQASQLASLPRSD